MSEIDRVRDQAQFDAFMSIASAADSLNDNEAFEALAAFLRVAFAVAANIQAIQLGDNEVTAQHAIDAVGVFLSRDARERPKRLQAIAAAAMELGHRDVRARKINDPSRDYPGDVQAYASGVPFKSVEVRGKSVPLTELDAFIEACVISGILRVVLLVDWPIHRSLDLAQSRSSSLQDGIALVSVYESAQDFVAEALTWSDLPLREATTRFAEATLERLLEVEASEGTLAEWVSLLET